MNELKPMTYEELVAEYRKLGIENAELRASITEDENDVLKQAEAYAEDQHIIEDLKKKLTDVEKDAKTRMHLLTKKLDWYVAQLEDAESREAAYRDLLENFRGDCDDEDVSNEDSMSCLETVEMPEVEYCNPCKATALLAPKE